MKPERRWMKWILAETAKPGTPLPWQRGARQTAARRIKSGTKSGTPAKG